jgi:hypothetical protein
METLQDILGVSTEIFASPLNVHKDTTAYCSQYERAKVFGTSGSAYEHTFRGIYEMNPE